VRQERQAHKENKAPCNLQRMLGQSQGPQGIQGSELDFFSFLISFLYLIPLVRAMKKKEPRIIQICPNCGHRVKATDFFSKNLVWGGQPASGGNITCPKCGYNGLPIEIKENDLSKIEFANKPMDRPMFVKMNWLSYVMLLGALGWVLLLIENAYPFSMALLGSGVIAIGIMFWLVSLIFTPMGFLVVAALGIYWIANERHEKK